METRAGRVRPIRIVPPGEILRAELAARGWTQQELAEIMGRPLAALNQIIGGKKQITAETATELGRAFGTSAELWLNLETAYRLSLTRTPESERKLTEITQRRALREAVPCWRELARQGWIDAGGGIGEAADSVLRLFGVQSLNEVGARAAAACYRRAASANADPVALLAWARRAEQLATQQTVPGYGRARLEERVPELLAHTATAAGAAAAPVILAQAGVRFVVVPHLARTKLDGAALQTGTGPIIALSLRYNRLDWFWFTLLHEVAHLAFGHEGSRLDDLEAVPVDDPQELEANQVASDWLIPPSELAAFREGLSGRISGPQVEAFARSIGRHPSIVVGRLQWQKVVPYSHLNQLKVKVAHYLG